MNSFSYRTVTTRVFNQPMSFEVSGYTDEEGEIFLTEIYAVGQGGRGEPKLSCVKCLLNVSEINAAIISLLREPRHSSIFKGSRK